MSDEPRSPALLRQARLKTALRDNLRRRKVQARDRAEALADTREPPGDRPPGDERGD